jgi:hypothetical protein
MLDCTAETLTILQKPWRVYSHASLSAAVQAARVFSVMSEVELSSLVRIGLVSWAFDSSR